MNLSLTRRQFEILETLESSGHLSQNDHDSKDFETLCGLGIITDRGVIT